MKNFTKLIAMASLSLSLTAYAEEPVDMSDRIVANSLLNEWRGNANTGWSQSDNVVELYNLTNAQKYQILTNMKAGIYTLECNGFYRYGQNHASADDEDSVEGFIYIKPGSTFNYSQSTALDPSVDDDVKRYGVKVKSLYSEPAYTFAPYTFPDRMNQAAAAFARGEYKNTASCTLESDGFLRIGFTTPSQWRAQRSWMCVGNFKLYYQEDENSARQDVTDMMYNAGFETNPGMAWSEYPVTIEDESAIKAGAHEWYRKTINMTQTVAGLDAGKYKVSCQAFHRGTHNVYLSANDSQIEVADFYSIKDEVDLGGKENIPGAGELFAEGYYINSVFVKISEGEDLKITLSKAEQVDKDWVAINHYSLVYLPPIDAPVLEEDLVDGVLYHDFNKGSRVIEITGDENLTVYYSYEPKADSRASAETGFTASDNGSVTVEQPGVLRYYIENKEGQECEPQILTIEHSQTTGIDGITVNENCDVEYYNLQGVRISTPVKGSMVIEKKGTEVRKVVY